MTQTGADKKCRILLVDDHPLVRESLTALIHQQPDLVVCGEAESNDEALEKITALKPELALIDISLKGSSGLQLVKTLKSLYPSILTIVLSMHDEKLYAERAIRAGARGYVTKRESSKTIVAAIRNVLDGKLAVSQTVSAHFAEMFLDGSSTASDDVSERLSDRELEVFRLLGQGVDTRSAAETLNISIKTVQAYCARIKEKLNLSNASELLREAIRWAEREHTRDMN